MTHQHLGCQSARLIMLSSSMAKPAAACSPGSGRCCHLSTIARPTPGIFAETNPANFSAYDQVIDVRTPAEYADDHLPGAVNLPLLDDADRHSVGKTFAESPFEGRRVGASLITKRIGQLLEGHFAGKGLDFRPLIYCRRGGQRSQSLALVLSQVGYSPTVLSGGYRAYRRLVVDDTGRIASGLSRLVVLAGLTGSGKTYWLGQLAKSGEQVIDLESLANHKGSTLGHDLNGTQPSQKAFESSLYRSLHSVDPGRPLWLECESVRIGQRFLPQPLFARMRESPRVLLEAPSSEDRVRRLCRQYVELISRPRELGECLQQLGCRYQSRQTLERWMKALEAGDTQGLAMQLLSDHYDPIYRRSRDRYFRDSDPARVARVRVTAEWDDADGSPRVEATVRDLVEAGSRLLTLRSGGCGDDGAGPRLANSVG